MRKVILQVIFFALALLAAPLHGQTAPACTIAGSDWAAKSLGNSQADTFSATFDATPQGNGIDANLAFSQDLPAAYTDLGAIVRFNPSGDIDVRNGDSYAAVYPQPYSANSTYHFVVVVNVPAHKYSVYVTPPEGTQQTLARDYAFRGEQADITSLNYWTTYRDPDSPSPLQICSFSLAAVPTGIAVSPASASLYAGGIQQFTAAVTGTTNAGVTWSATGGMISSTGLYTAPATGGTYTVTATSVVDPSQSASASVTVAGNASSSCTPGATSWVANSLASSQTGTFTASFDATPQGVGLDADVAFSQGTPGAYTDLAAIVRFNAWGHIDVMNGSGYRADYSQTYSAKSTYHFEVIVNIPANSYSVYVTPPGGTQQTLASNYAFRGEQAGVSSLNYWTTYQDPDSPSPIQVCNLSLAADAAPSVTVSMSPASASVQAGDTQQFAASVTGTTNTGVTWSASGGTISSTGLYTAPAAAGTYTVTATSAADPAKSASAVVTVSASSCTLTTTNWVSNSLANSQTGTFSASFDATPQAKRVDAIVGFSQDEPGAYTDLAAIVRFNSFGYLDVMNLTGFRADSLQPYSANSTYHFLVAVNVATRTYSVYVTPPGGTQQTLASNYAFRLEQAFKTSLNYWTSYQDPDSLGSIQVCNLSLPIAPAGPAGGVKVAVSPTSAPLQPLGTQQFTATVTGTTNTGVTWSASGGVILPTGLYVAPLSAGAYTVTATSVTDPKVSAVANVTVTTPVVALLSASPAVISFGSVVTGTPATKTVTLTNIGVSQVTVFSASIAGADFSLDGFSFPLALAAGASQTGSVTFTPSISGTASGSVSFVSNATNSPTTVTASGSGVAPLPHSVTLSWQPSASSVAGYNVYRSTTNGGPYARLNTAAIPGGGFVDSGVQSGQTYYYVVTAVDNAGRESNYSNQSAAVVPTP